MVGLSGFEEAGTTAWLQIDIHAQTFVGSRKISLFDVVHAVNGVQALSIIITDLQSTHWLGGSSEYGLFLECNMKLAVPDLEQTHPGGKAIPKSGFGAELLDQIDIF